MQRDVQETESRATRALENGAEVAHSSLPASASIEATLKPGGGVEMRPLPDMPASAPFWYQVLTGVHPHCVPRDTFQAAPRAPTVMTSASLCFSGEPKLKFVEACPLVPSRLLCHVLLQALTRGLSCNACHCKF